MSRRLHQAIALWFVLQIVLPFTAPLQTLDFHDLFGGKSHHAATTSPESTTTPTMTDASPVAAIASLLAPAAAAAVDRVASPEDVTTRGPLVSSRQLLPAPQVQRSVLRL